MRRKGIRFLSYSGEKRWLQSNSSNWTELPTITINLSVFTSTRCIFIRYNNTKYTNDYYDTSILLCIIFLGWNDYNSVQFGYCLRLAFDWGDCFHRAVPLVDYCKYWNTKRFWNIGCMKALLKCIWVYRNNARFACKPLLVLGLNLSPFYWMNP